MKKGVLDSSSTALPDACLAGANLSLCSTAPAQHPGQRPALGPQWLLAVSGLYSGIPGIKLYFNFLAISLRDPLKATLGPVPSASNKCRFLVQTRLSMREEAHGWPRPAWVLSPFTSRNTEGPSRAAGHLPKGSSLRDFGEF